MVKDFIYSQTGGSEVPVTRPMPVAAGTPQFRVGEPVKLNGRFVERAVDGDGAATDRFGIVADRHTATATAEGTALVYLPGVQFKVRALDPTAVETVDLVHALRGSRLTMNLSANDRFTLDTTTDGANAFRVVDGDPSEYSLLVDIAADSHVLTA